MSRPSDASADRRRALFLTAEAPYPPVGGGALRSASLLEYLARGYELDVIVFREPGAADPAAAIPAGLARATHVIALPPHSRHPWRRATRNLRRMLAARPPLNDRFGGFGDSMARFLNGRRYHLAVIEHFWCAPYAEQAVRHAERVVLDLHNIESVLLAGCAKTEPWPLSFMLRRFQHACERLEQRWLPRFDLVMTASETDAERLRRLFPGARVDWAPNTIPMVPRPHRTEEEAIVFSGNLEYRPNVSAIRYFRRQIWPLLRERGPGLRWRIVGRNPEAVRRYVRDDPRIELTGPVEDAVSELARAKVAVVPVLAGSGTRVKIIEAWAAARAVVSTPLGAEGLGAEEGKHLLLASGPREFAAKVAGLLEDGGARAELGASARHYFERNLTWEAAWGRLEEIGI